MILNWIREIVILREENYMNVSFLYDSSFWIIENPTFMLKILCGRNEQWHKESTTLRRCNSTEPEWRSTPGKLASMCQSQKHQPICPGNIKMTFSKLDWMFSLEGWPGLDEREEVLFLGVGTCLWESVTELRAERGTVVHVGSDKSVAQRDPIRFPGKILSPKSLKLSQQYWFLDKKWWSFLAYYWKSNNLGSHSQELLATLRLKLFEIWYCYLGKRRS